jgi:TolB-like protein/DNA-binding winged helix-turn-helix (wHTH) protein
MILQFAGYFLDARRRLLIGPDGVPVEIPSRAFELLQVLASHPHQLLDKRRLMQAVWPNSVVEENNLNQQISVLRKLLGDTSGHHRFIVTVTGQGFRFVQDVRELESLPPAAERATEDSRRRWSLRPAAVAAAAVVLMLGAAFILLAGRESSPGAAGEAPSIAVLPFADVSPDRDQGYFADGLSEELLNALGRLNGVRVIGRTSSFSFKGKSEDVREVAETLGVRHVLEGSVRREGERLRITAQLVDAGSGSQLWAESYDRRLGDVFEIQKQIADSVAATLQLRLQPVRLAALAGGTRNLEAYDAYLSARAVTNEGGSNRAREAVSFLERAVQLDPDFALAWAALAETYTFAMDFAPSSDLPLTPLELQQRISRAAMRAFELAPEAPQTLRSAGMVSMQNRDWAEAERRLRKAVELAGPYDYESNLFYAWFLMNVGRPGEAIPYEERAKRAEPLLMRPVALLAMLYEMRGELDKAEALLLGSSHLQGHESMRRKGQIMVQMARGDRSGLRRLLAPEGMPCPLLDDPSQALEVFRQEYEDATRTGAQSQFVPVAIFSSFLGDKQLSLNALRALGTSQHLHSLWRTVLSDVRRLPEFPEYMQEIGLVDYWRASGNWGEFCRETGSGGITCS